MTATPGTVYLVGAGPGDPGLMTVRAMELLASADVIVHDRLIPPGILNLARSDAQIINVGKEGGGPSTPQERIEEVLVEHGGAGRSVLRLKGGDPFVFGRGGEEALTLRAAGIHFEVIPGVTAGVAAPATAGIPVTQRGMASAVALVTGHEDPSKGETSLDYPALAQFPGTLVLYMGVRRLGAIADSLIAAGRPADQPAALIERGTLPDQRTVVTTLEELAATAEREGIKAPAITLVGDVAALQSSLAWQEQRPLNGIRIAVTRARAQAGSLSRKLGSLGALTVEVPAIRTEPVDADKPLDPRGFDLLCVTSTNSARLLFDRLAAAGLDARALSGITVAAIGPGTARELAARGITADIVPARSISDALLDVLKKRSFKRALLVQAEAGRDTLASGLRSLGVEVETTVLYRTIAEPLDSTRITATREADVITFTSASTVRFLLEAVGGAAGLSREDGSRPKLISIGPNTSNELRVNGLEPDLEAADHDIDGLVAAVVLNAGR
ncbi:MAG: uroporphyrinogen-III C-methyltransferase [Actinomycetes bacterium]